MCSKICNSEVQLDSVVFKINKCSYNLGAFWASFGKIGQTYRHREGLSELRLVKVGKFMNKMLKLQTLSTIGSSSFVPDFLRSGG